MINCDICNELMKGRRMRTHLISKHMWGVFSCHLCQGPCSHDVHKMFGFYNPVHLNSF